MEHARMEQARPHPPHIDPPRMETTQQARYAFPSPYPLAPAPSAPAAEGFSSKAAPPTKPRGARACMSCRRVKMKCVGGDEGKPCERCTKNGSACHFEQHRRGRKPGAPGLSDKSKELRKLDQGLSEARRKLAPCDTTAAAPSTTAGSSSARPSSSSAHAPTEDSDEERDELEDDEDDRDNESARFQHASTLGKHAHPDGASQRPDEPPTRRKTEEGDAPSPGSLHRLLNPGSFTPAPATAHTSAPSPASAATSANASSTVTAMSLPGPAELLNDARPSYDPAPAYPHARAFVSERTDARDPLEAGLVDRTSADRLLGRFMQKMNPQLGLLDPAQCSVDYLSSPPSQPSSPGKTFLLAALLAVGSAFWMREAADSLRRLAEEHAVCAFMHAGVDAGVETVQAFIVLSLWPTDPASSSSAATDALRAADARRWTWLGVAARIALELAFNAPWSRYRETAAASCERRARERTFYVLFVLDRCAGVQRGREWMMHADVCVRRVGAWVEEGLDVEDDRELGTGERELKKGDVLLGALVQLMDIAGAVPAGVDAEDGGRDGESEVVVRDAHVRVREWSERWRRRMEDVGAETGQFAIMRLHQLHVRLFLNAFTLRPALHAASGGMTRDEARALNGCVADAMETLDMAATVLKTIDILPFLQANLAAIVAHAAQALVQLLRHPDAQRFLPDGTLGQARARLSTTAGPFTDAARSAPASLTAAHGDLFRHLLRQLEDVRPAPMFDAYRPVHDPVRTSYARPTSEHGWARRSLDEHAGPPPPAPQSSSPATAQYHNAQLQPLTMPSPRAHSVQYPTPSPDPPLPLSALDAHPSEHDADEKYRRCMFRDAGFDEADGL